MFVSLSMIILCIYSPVCSIWFGPVYSLLPGVTVCVYLALPCLALPCLALPCLALPCLALPCLALPCLVWSHGLFELHPRLRAPNPPTPNRAISTSLYADLNCFVEMCLYRIWTRGPRLLNTSPYSVSYRTNLPSMKTHRYEADMCDANVQKHQFSNLPAF